MDAKARFILAAVMSAMMVFMVTLLVTWLNLGFRDDFLNLRYEEDPTLVITELVDLAQQVAHTEYRPGPFPSKPRAV